MSIGFHKVDFIYGFDLVKIFSARLSVEDHSPLRNSIRPVVVSVLTAPLNGGRR